MKTLIYKGILLISIILFYSCSTQEADENKDKAELLGEYRVQMEELRQKIARLEKDLENSGDRSIVNVALTTVTPTLFEHYIDVMGRVHSENNLMVRPEISGNIVEILVKEGDHVRKGDFLARLNTDALDQSIEELEINLDLAKTLYERQENLWSQNIGSEVQYLQAKSNMESQQRRLESLKAQRSMSVVTAPVNGVVDEIIQKQGEMAGPSLPFARVVNLEHMYITGDVADSYLQRITSGDSLKVEYPVLDVIKDEVITRTSSVIDPDSRTFRIRVDVNNPNGNIRPNLMAILKLRTFKSPDAIVVPSLLIKQDFTGQFLFVAEENGGDLIARKRYVETGLNDNNRTIVTQGLNPGDRIISGGFAQVVDGTFLNIHN